MASRRPHLVEEGSPIGYGDAIFDNVTNNDHNNQNSNSSRYGGRTSTTSAAEAAANTSLAAANAGQTKRFHTGGGAGGVRSRLVIGGDNAYHDDDPYGVNDNDHMEGEGSIFGNDNKQHYPGGGRGGVRTRLVIGGDDDNEGKNLQHNVDNSERSFQHHQYCQQQRHYHHHKQHPYQQHQQHQMATHSSPFDRTNVTSTSPNPTAAATTTTAFSPPSANLSYENDMDMDDEDDQHHQHQYEHPQAHHHHESSQQQQHQYHQHHRQLIEQQQQQQQQQQQFNHPHDYINRNQHQPYHHQQPQHFHREQEAMIGQQQQSFNPNDQYDAQKQNHYPFNFQQQQQQHQYHHEQAQQNHSTTPNFPPSQNPPPQTHTPPPPSPQQPTLSPSNSPLVVIDGANIAYNYADASAPSFTSSKNNKSNNEPNALGIQIVVNYFKDTCRVSVVLPATWMRSKPREHDTNRDNAMMITPQLETLHYLKSHGYLCMAPPKDDDDAYVLAIARKADEKGLEERRKLRENVSERKGVASDCFDNMGDEGDKKDNEKDDRVFWGRGYVLSADFFRDAIQRDDRRRRKNGDIESSSTSLKRWLEKGSCDDDDNHHNNHNEYGPNLSDNGSIRYSGGPGRISYSFYNAGSTDAVGNSILDFVPNPRHPLVEWIERKRRRMGA